MFICYVFKNKICMQYEKKKINKMGLKKYQKVTAWRGFYFFFCTIFAAAVAIVAAVAVYFEYFITNDKLKGN